MNSSVNSAISAAFFRLLTQLPTYFWLWYKTRIADKSGFGIDHISINFKYFNICLDQEYFLAILILFILNIRSFSLIAILHFLINSCEVLAVYITFLSFSPESEGKSVATTGIPQERYSMILTG